MLSTAYHLSAIFLLLLCLQHQLVHVSATNNAPQFIHFTELTDIQAYPGGSSFEPTLSFHQIGNDPFVTVADGAGCRVYYIKNYFTSPNNPKDWKLEPENNVPGPPNYHLVSACMLHRPPDQEKNFLWIQYGECDEWASVECDTHVYERPESSDDAYGAPLLFPMQGVRECGGVPNRREVFCACFKNDDDEDAQSPMYQWNDGEYELKANDTLASITGVDAYYFETRNADSNGFMSSDALVSPVYMNIGGEEWTAEHLEIQLSTISVSACELVGMKYPACAWASQNGGIATLWCYNEDDEEMRSAGGLEVGGTRRVRCLNRTIVNPSYAIQVLEDANSILHACDPVDDKTELECEVYDDTSFPSARDADVFAHSLDWLPQIIAFIEDRPEQGYVISFYADTEIRASPPPSSSPTLEPSPSDIPKSASSNEDIAMLLIAVLIPIAGMPLLCCSIYCCRYKRADGTEFRGESLFTVSMQAIKEAVQHLLDPFHDRLNQMLTAPQFRGLCLLLVLGNVAANICFLVLLNYASAVAVGTMMLCLYIFLTAEKKAKQFGGIDLAATLVFLVAAYILFLVALEKFIENPDEEIGSFLGAMGALVGMTGLYCKLAKVPAEKLGLIGGSDDDGYSNIQ